MAAPELFDTIVVERTAPRDPRVAELIGWAARLVSLGWTPSYGSGDHGNLSCRTAEGLLISARETAKAHLEAGQFVEVIGLTERGARAEVRCRGLRLPSTDTWLHWRIYDARPDIQAIFHGHDPEALASAAVLGLPVTARSGATSSRELIEEACALARSHDYFLLRDHGFFSLGRTIQAAGETALGWSTRKRLASGTSGPT